MDEVLDCENLGSDFQNPKKAKARYRRAFIYSPCISAGRWEPEKREFRN